MSVRIRVADIQGPEHLAELEEKFGQVRKYVSGKNKGLPKVFREDTDEPLMKWGEKVYECPGLVDLGLLPADLRKEFEREFTGKRTLADGSPVYSTGADALETLEKRPEFSEEAREVIRGLLEFAKLDKDLGTYYLREVLDEEGNVLKQSGMLQFLNDQGKVHHNLNMTSTVTTRLSSNRPNFQNLPRGGTSEVKRMFVSRYGRDGFIVEADYSALEVVTLAAFSRDTALVRALMDNIDMHCLRLAANIGEPYEEVLRKCKDENHPEHSRYDQMRTNIKPRAFALI